MKKTFTYEEAVEVLPEVIRRTEVAVHKAGELIDSATGPTEEDIPVEKVAEYQDIVRQWADSIVELGVEVKGLWLVDFDSGAGYYCWRHPEPSLQFFHGYEEGFQGRVRLT